MAWFCNYTLRSLGKHDKYFITGTWHLVVVDRVFNQIVVCNETFPEQYLDIQSIFMLKTVQVYSTNLVD